MYHALELIDNILGLFTIFVLLAFANESTYGKSVVVIRAPIYD